MLEPHRNYCFVNESESDLARPDDSESSNPDISLNVSEKKKESKVEPSQEISS